MTRAYAPDGDMDAELSAFFHKHMADGSMVEWVVEEAGEIIATGAVVFYDFPPAFFDPVSIRGYVTNMYTAPAHRGQGIATRMLEPVRQEAVARRAGLMWLGASKLGRPVYEKFGFREDNSWLVMHNGD